MAWRAPNNQQAAYLTCSAIEDFAAKAGLDPLEVFKLNLQYAPKARQDLYRYQFDKAAELSEWKARWKPRGASAGPVKRGMGLGFSAWGGGGHASQCKVTLHADGSVALQERARRRRLTDHLVVAFEQPAEQPALQVTDGESRLTA